MESVTVTGLPDTAGGQTFVDVLNAAVLRDGRPLELSPSERVLAVALAVQTRPLRAAYLAELLNPERDYDPEGARNLIKVYVYRLRRRAGEDFVVCAPGGGYCLGPSVRTDVAQLRPFLTEVLVGLDRLSADERARLEDIARAMRAEAPVEMLRYEWYAAISRRLARQGQDLAFALAKHAFQLGDFTEAIRLTRELIYDDPSNEEALELSIRALLGAGEHGSAAHELHRYRSVLAEELQALPSPHLAQLVRNHAAFGSVAAPMSP